MATDFVDKFKRYLKEDGKSPKTVESYVGDLAGFVAYIQNVGVKFQGELKRFYVTSFRNYLIERQDEIVLLITIILFSFQIVARKCIILIPRQMKTAYSNHVVVSKAFVS